MSTSPIYDRSKITTPRVSVSEVARRCLALRMITQTLGFNTTRTIGEELEKLSSSQLVELGELLFKTNANAATSQPTEDRP